MSQFVVNDNFIALAPFYVVILHLETALGVSFYGEWEFHRIGPSLKPYLETVHSDLGYFTHANTDPVT
jgi:hypothetical protein